MLQAANEALLKLLQVPKAVPQHAVPQHVISPQHYQHQQQYQQQQARPLQNTPALPVNGLSSQALLQSAGLGIATASQQLPFGALQLQQQLQQRPQQQPQAQAPQLWQARPGVVNAAPTLPTGVSFLQAPVPGLGSQAAHASLAPLAKQISAANLAGPSQPGTAAVGISQTDRHTIGTSQTTVASLPASVVLSGVPVRTSAPVQPALAPPVVPEETRNT